MKSIAKFGQTIIGGGQSTSRMSSGIVSMSSRSDDFVNYMEHYECIKKIEDYIPKLKYELRKGDCGRIGVIGGSLEYTGAPFFAGMSALKTGADLVYILCSRDAGQVIKSYSPELIVLPVLDNKDVVKKTEHWLNQIHVLIVGPGLGRDPVILRNVGSIVAYCKEKIRQSPPIIFDADGLYFVRENLDLLKNYKAPIIYTPNLNEYNKLASTLSSKDPFETAMKLNGILVQKGQRDLIINGIYQKQLEFIPKGDVSLVCEVGGSVRRCGGQGDLIAGCMATFVGWVRMFLEKNMNDVDLMSFDFSEEDSIKTKKFFEKFMGFNFAAYAACTLIRSCSKFAFDERGRAMTASDMIPYIHKAFKLHFRT